MLAYLTDEQPTLGERAARDVALDVPAPDDQGVWAQVAYEAAQQSEAERWIPARRRRAERAGASPRDDRGTWTNHHPRASHTRRAIAELCAQRDMRAQTWSRSAAPRSGPTPLDGLTPPVGARSSDGAP